MKERTKNRTTHLVMAICSIAVGILVALTNMMRYREAGQP